MQVRRSLPGLDGDPVRTRRFRELAPSRAARTIATSPPGGRRASLRPQELVDRSRRSGLLGLGIAGTFTKRKRCRDFAPAPIPPRYFSATTRSYQRSRALLGSLPPLGRAARARGLRLGISFDRRLLAGVRGCRFADRRFVRRAGVRRTTPARPAFRDVSSEG